MMEKNWQLTKLDEDFSMKMVSKGVIDQPSVRPQFWKNYDFICINKLILVNFLGTSSHIVSPEADLQEFDEQDVKRLRHDDIWLRCFVRARKQEVEKALEALVGVH